MNDIRVVDCGGEKGRIYPQATVSPRSSAPQDINSLTCVVVSRSCGETGLSVNRESLGQKAEGCV